MLLLRVTDSRGAVTQHIAERFPYTIGRSAQAHLRLQEPGIFENHATIHPAENGRFLIQAEGESLLLRNGEPVRSAPLAAGDELWIGSLKVVAGLAPARSKSLGLAEAIAWTLMAAVVAGEIAVLVLAR